MCILESDYKKMLLNLQAQGFGGGGGVVPSPAPARGLYEHYHAIFDQLQQQRENIKTAEGKEAELREKQALEPVDRYVCFY